MDISSPNFPKSLKRFRTLGGILSVISLVTSKNIFPSFLYIGFTYLLTGSPKTAFNISLLVMIPTSIPFSRTGILPMLCSIISSLIFVTGVSGVTVTNLDVMMDFIGRSPRPWFIALSTAFFVTIPTSLFSSTIGIPLWPVLSIILFTSSILI